MHWAVLAFFWTTKAVLGQRDSMITGSWDWETKETEKSPAKSKPCLQFKLLRVEDLTRCFWTTTVWCGPVVTIFTQNLEKKCWCLRKFRTFPKLWQLLVVGITV